MQELSLWKLDHELEALVNVQAERMGDTDDPPSAEELAAMQAEIAKYLEALPRKVDGVAGWFRAKESQLTAILGPKSATGTRKGGEVDRLRAIAADIEGQVARLKGIVAEVLERQPAPAKGSRKLVGATGSQLILKGNGGVEPLVISQPELVPDDLSYFEGRVSHELYCELMKVGLSTPELAHEVATAFKRVPSPSLIREALIQPCDLCDGKGDSEEATTCRSDGAPCKCPAQHCPSCGGTGRRGVPGAHLGERLNHVEIR